MAHLDLVVQQIASEAPFPANVTIQDGPPQGNVHVTLEQHQELTLLIPLARDTKDIELDARGCGTVPFNVVLNERGLTVLFAYAMDTAGTRYSFSAKAVVFL